MATEKAANKKAPAKTTPARKTAATGKHAKHSAGTKAAARKYSPAASAQVGKELHEMHEGKLHSGHNGPVVTNPKQAIAIALSEARRAGKKVPPNPNDAKR